MPSATPGLEPLILLALLLPAAAIDITRHRIPNLLTYPAILGGLALALAGGGAAALGNHLLGLLLAAFPLYLMFLGGSLGGGDVKLMAAVGAITGFPVAVNALIASILVGGLCAALILIWQGRLLGLARYSWATVWHRVGLAQEPPEPLPRHKDAFPFAVAIAIGSCLVALPPDLLTRA
jgi:prepilin peptidase CpaA